MCQQPASEVKRRWGKKKNVLPEPEAHTQDPTAGAEQEMTIDLPEAEKFAVKAEKPKKVHTLSGWPEMPANIAGQGKHAGRKPRSAGIIGFLQVVETTAARQITHVCLVEKANGKRGFPKGGREAGETVQENAIREWVEETGIAPARLSIQSGIHLDEAHIGCRYLVAMCAPPSTDITAVDSMPGKAAVSWSPPLEDPTDPDPIVKASWVPLQRALRGDAGLAKPRLELLQQAVAALGISTQS